MRARFAVVAVLVVLTACGSPPSPGHNRSAAGSAMQARPLASGATLFAWTKTGRRAAPWLLYVHGGSWRAGRGDSPTAVALASHELPRGYQVFSVGYRLSTDARWPAQRDDVAAAVDRIRADAGSFGIAPSRGVVIGESAGGQLAAIEASRGRTAGLVDLAGAVDPVAALHAPLRRLGESARLLVGCAPTVCPSRWRDTRAVNHVTPHTPPALIVHAAGDPIVPASMSRAYADALRAAGRRVTLRIVDGRSHGLLFRPEVLPAVDGFLDQITGRG